MADTFFFYDLETSGFSPRTDRIMQFAGQRTDLDLKPIGKPFEFLIKLTPDVLPAPDAVLLTGITPQKTIKLGLTEAEFLKIFYKQIVQPNTIFVGFNNIRFDDEFMRFTNYRNFYDAYEWQWKDNCSRFDTLDLIRMTRALRPSGINWPFAPDGKPANRLEYLTSVNKINHDGAHDALVDVNATISMAQLIKTKQPELFNYLLKMRDKKNVAELIESNKPFVYTSGHYPSSELHTSVVVKLTKLPKENSAVVYNLREDPTPFLKMTIDELIEAWKYDTELKATRLPLKTLKYNRAPAIAPIGVIDEEAKKRLDIDMAKIYKHLEILKKDQQVFSEKMLKVIERLSQIRQNQASLVDDQLTVDERLYDGFLSNLDKPVMESVRTSPPNKLNSLGASLKDDRLKSLLPLYKARNYPSSLDKSELNAWQDFCNKRLASKDRLSLFFGKLDELAKTTKDAKSKHLIEDLRHYGESLEVNT